MTLCQLKVRPNSSSFPRHALQLRISDLDAHLKIRLVTEVLTLDLACCVSNEIKFDSPCEGQRADLNSEFPAAGLQGAPPSMLHRLEPRTQARPT